MPHKKDDDSETIILKGIMTRKKEDPALQTYGSVAGELVSDKGKYRAIVSESGDIANSEEN